MMLKEYDHGKVCMHVCVCLLCTSLDTYYIYTLIHHMYVIYKDSERERERAGERERKQKHDECSGYPRSYDDATDVRAQCNSGHYPYVGGEKVRLRSR